MDTIYTDCSSQSNKEAKKTVFTHTQYQPEGWASTNTKPSSFIEVKYLGHRRIDGDMFAATTNEGNIVIFKGIKGDEFDK